MNKTRSKVMTIANRLVKQGLTRSIATVKAYYDQFQAFPAAAWS